MLKITNAVEQIIREDDIAFFTLQSGTLNCSAYAKRIKNKVEELCKKPVINTTAIIMALTRLGSAIKKEHITLPEIGLLDLEIKKNLCEIVFPKNPEIIVAAQKLFLENSNQQNLYFTMNIGQNEFSILVSKQLLEKTKTITKTKPLVVLENLACLTFHTDIVHMHTANVFYSLLRKFATKELNIIEILTTYTEISLIIEDKNLPTFHQMLYRLMK